MITLRCVAIRVLDQVEQAIFGSVALIRNSNSERTGILKPSTGGMRAAHPCAGAM